ncbi:MAG: hypothetical protein EHM42_11950, partial [Planctomycetaceae bacterium]
MQTSGQGFTSFGETAHLELQGEGPYTRPGSLSATIAGTGKEQLTLDSAVAFHTNSTWSAGTGWITTGGASDFNSSVWSSEYKGSGAFSIPGEGDPATVPAPLTGTETESGNSSGYNSQRIEYTFVPPPDAPPLAASYDSAATQPRTPVQTDWVVSGGVSDEGSSAASSTSYTGSRPSNSSGTDPQFGNWSVSGTVTVSGGSSSHSRQDLQAALDPDRNSWFAVSGSGSAGGGSGGSSSFTGEGTYNYVNGANSLSGTTKGAAGSSDSNTWQTSSQVNSGAALLANGLDSPALWTTTGSGGGSSSQFDSLQFITNQGTYANGTIIESVFQRSSATGGFTLQLSTAGLWNQASGTVESLNFGGVQAELQGGGSLDSSGTVLGEEGETVSQWNFGGSFTESAMSFEGAGVFSDWEWRTGTQDWVATDYGALLIAGDRSESDWSGTGTFSSGAATGTYRNSGYGSADSNAKIKDGVILGLRGTATTHNSDGKSNRWNSTEDTSLFGIAGTYTAGEQSSSSSGKDLEWALGTNDEWSLKSGNSFAASHYQATNQFEGATTPSTGSSGPVVSQTYSFANSTSFDTIDGFSYSPAV